MPKHTHCGLIFRLIGLWLFGALSATAGVLSADLERALARGGTHADTAIIVRFADVLNWDEYTQPRPQLDRLERALKLRLQSNRARLEPWLTSAQPSRIRELWMINALALKVPAIAVRQLQAEQSVARVDLDSFVQGGRSQRTPLSRTARGAAPASPPDRADDTPGPAPSPVPALQTSGEPEWNLKSIHVPDLWAKGYTGRGVVVATMDTGADLAHPALARNWRGGSNSWFDPHGEEATPYDALGHGTQALGILAGGDAVGVAPGAQWIAARLYNAEGRASMSDIHLAFQWLMDPDDNPDTADAPDVVNASWSLAGRMTGNCSLEFDDDLRALRAAGIAVVFAAGNDGPKPATSNSPGNNPGVVSVGAMDQSQVIARSTSRGPSACDGSLFPRLLAPGVNVRTTDLSHGGLTTRTSVSGSSMAAPHVAGVMALLKSAFPGASVAELEAAVQSGAPAGEPVRLDALAALKALQAVQSAPRLPVPAGIKN